MKKEKEQVPLIVWVGIIFLAGLFIGYLTLFPGDNITGAPTSSFGNLTVNVISVFGCTISNENFNVSFGDNVAQNTKQNASNNYIGYSYTPIGAQNMTRYNVSSDSTNTVDINFTINGRDLVVQPTTPGGFLGVGNVSWNSTCSPGVECTTQAGLATNNTMVFPGRKNISTSFLEGSAGGDIAWSLPLSSTVWIRYWLNVPANQLAGKYVGNHTTQCTDAT